MTYRTTGAIPHTEGTPNTQSFRWVCTCNQPMKIINGIMAAHSYLYYQCEYGHRWAHNVTEDIWQIDTESIAEASAAGKTQVDNPTGEGVEPSEPSPRAVPAVAGPESPDVGVPTTAAAHTPTGGQLTD